MAISISQDPIKTRYQNAFWQPPPMISISQDPIKTETKAREQHETAYFNLTRPD